MRSGKQGLTEIESAPGGKESPQIGRMERTGCYSLNACRFLSPRHEPPVLPVPGKDHRRIHAREQPLESPGDVSGSTPGSRAWQPPRPGHLKERLRRRVSHTIRVVDECPSPGGAPREPAPASTLPDVEGLPAGLGRRQDAGGVLDLRLAGPVARLSMMMTSLRSVTRISYTNCGGIRRALDKQNRH